MEPRAYLREATLRAVRNPGPATLARDLKSPRSSEKSTVDPLELFGRRGRHILPGADMIIVRSGGAAGTIAGNCSELESNSTGVEPNQVASAGMTELDVVTSSLPIDLLQRRCHIDGAIRYARRP